MSNNSKPKKVNTPPFRVSYANVFKPRENNLSGNSEFGLTALFPKGADLSALYAIAEEAAKTKWPNGVPKGIRSPFRDQGEKAKQHDDGSESLPDGYEAGCTFINMKSVKRPGVVDQNVQPILDESEFYSGCWAIASVNAYAYDNKGNKGVSIGLINVQKIKDDEALSGRSTPQDDFKPIAAAVNENGGGAAKTSQDRIFG